VEELSQHLMQAKTERDMLMEELDRLHQSSEAEATSQEMENSRMAAGLMAVQGPGIIITIDNQKGFPSPGKNPSLYSIRDDDLLKVMNELKAAGAEAIAINEQRVVAMTEIRTAGNAIAINNTYHAAPYQIKSIGDPAALENSLKMKGGVADTLEFWGIKLTIERSNLVKIPGYRGLIRYEYGKPVDHEKG
jgi:uncharacterized protein YlxW (UPF0749 family)